MKKIILLSFISLLLFSPFALLKAQELLPDTTEIVKAKVLSIEQGEPHTVPGLDTPTTNQIITAEVLGGIKEGESVTFSNDYILLEVGDTFYLRHTVSAVDGREFFSVEDSYGLPVIYFFAILFIALVILVGGIQGVRGLLSLAGSFLLIIYILLPGIMAGYSPVLVSIGVSSLIIILGSYITHGFNKTTSSAVFGMIITVTVTGIMAYVAVNMSQFTGFSNEEAFYLSLNSRGNIDIIGILIGGMMIGLLGVLYDVAIGQSISVEELHHIAPHIPRKAIFQRAIRIGREHIGALVNTLAIAYVGASLPLFLLFSTPPVNIAMTINREIFATEILRALIGSIGLVLAVPVTTLLAVIMLVKIKKSEDHSVLEKEGEALEHYAHHH